MLNGKKILLGITGSIAAYKIPFLIRLLVKEGAEVKVVMSRSACDFVTPLTLSALSQNPVSIEPFDQVDGTWHSHIELGSWADVFVLAPLSANTMAKMATGITDNLLTATYLAARCPVFFAPAMDVDMFEHPVTQQNLIKLQSLGNILIKPTSGALASGLTGFGRMEEPENILAMLMEHFRKSASLLGKKVLISSGPTREAIDPVRYISNHSSGIMGNALALAAAARGAEVTLVTGPVSGYPEHPNIQVINVTSADQMYDACVSAYGKADIAIMAAAVADYKPAQVSLTKLKKSEESYSLLLEKTKDILAELGKTKQNQLLVGFALETDHELDNARKKLHTKNLDVIVLNSLKVSGAGFSTITNQITIIDSSGEIMEYDLKPKSAVAEDILDYLLNKSLK